MQRRILYKIMKIRDNLEDCPQETVIHEQIIVRGFFRIATGDPTWPVTVNFSLGLINNFFM